MQSNLHVADERITDCVPYDFVFSSFYVYTSLYVWNDHAEREREAGHKHTPAMCFTDPSVTHSGTDKAMLPIYGKKDASPQHLKVYAYI